MSSPFAGQVTPDAFNKSSDNINLAEKSPKIEESINTARREIRYDTREFTIEYLVAKLNNGLEKNENEIYVPDYQRPYVWKPEDASRFIEAVFQGLPLPYLFFAEMSDGRLEIIDGSQRIRTLSNYVQGKLKLTGLDIIHELNGTKFNDLTESRKRKFKNNPMRCIVLTEGDEDTRALLFERINTTGKALTDMQMRKAAEKGLITDLLYELSQHTKFKGLTQFTPIAIKQNVPEELILRFLAFSYKLANYEKFRSLGDFLDAFLTEANNEAKVSADYVLTCKKDFERVLDFIEQNYPTILMEGKNKTPRTRFEAVTVGTYLALQDFPDLTLTQEILIDDEFKKQIGGNAGSATYQRVKHRVEYFKEKLLEGNK